MPRKAYIILNWPVVDGVRKEPPVRLLVEREDEEAALAAAEFVGDGEREVELEREATAQEIEFYDPTEDENFIVAHNIQPGRDE